MRTWQHAGCASAGQGEPGESWHRRHTRRRAVGLSESALACDQGTVAPRDVPTPGDQAGGNTQTREPGETQTGDAMCSYGFRPGRSAHQAVAQAYIEQGYSYVVDIDLEKFFDRVCHDRLMSRLAKRITDKRVLKLIRAFLQAGIFEDGLMTIPTEGTPQGSPLSPFLSNVVLDELDKELEGRGHRFCRYADDSNI